VWFADAAAVGLGTDLELLAARSALELISVIEREQYLAINVSPATLVTDKFREFAFGVPLDRVVFEITEHEPVDDYDVVNALSRELRRRGARVAVDDAGAGYASLQHILKLEPDIIKLDIELTRHIDADPIKTALAGALASFAQEIGATITAEGIETGEELRRLQQLGISHGQGYYLGRPAPVATGRSANRVAP
jgi:EAL domain-containing protein (putative c-di-GMP-specific phosphodiesterase class I)